MNTIINAIPEYVITAVISTAFYFGLKYARGLIHSKIVHAKTEQSKTMWSLLEAMADTVVASLVKSGMSGDQKFNQATNTIQKVLIKQGFTNVNINAIQAAVQAAYEKSPLTNQKEEK